MMLHDDIVAEIQARAKRRGILSHYCGHAIHCKGDRGAPDLLLVGHFGAAWVEVKTGSATLDPGQTTWKHALRAAGQEHHVIREPDLHNGQVNWLLDLVSLGAVA
jgi:hypothetical protein